MWPTVLLPLLLAVGHCADAISPPPVQQPLTQSAVASAVSVPFFAGLERLSRLVDISYCIGTSGVRKPFECLSRCKEFPSLELNTTWNTGIFLSDSCGYIAVDNGSESDGEAGERVFPRSPSIVVAFRGTYSITNTVVDLSTVPQKYVPYPSPDDGGDGEPEKPSHECHNCTVHMGFLRSWKNARKLVLPELMALRKEYPDHRVQLVGHSLGGAVACLAALELKVSLGWQNVEVTTFGEPRVGNGNLARFVDEVFDLDADVDPESRSYRRVTHNDDPVPLLPLSEWDYKSHAGEIYISKKSLSPSETDLQHCTGDEDADCSAGADGGFLSDVTPFHSSDGQEESAGPDMVEPRAFPTRLKLWQLFFAHRDYFWRLGLCVPGGDPVDWWRDGYSFEDSDSSSDEL